MKLFVLDNSITMRWVFDDATHPHADAVLQDLESLASHAVVPVLRRYEVSAVLAREQRRGRLPAHKATRFLEALAILPITVDEESASRVFSDVHRLALSFRLTSYDAACLELCLRRDLPLATLDAELRAACQKTDVALI